MIEEWDISSPEALRIRRGMRDPWEWFPEESRARRRTLVQRTRSIALALHRRRHPVLVPVSSWCQEFLDGQLARVSGAYDVGHGP